MVHSTGTRNQISLRRAFGHQKQAMSFFLPQRVDAAIREEYRNTMSPGIACLTPFGYEVRKDIRGPFIAVNVATGSPFFLSKFDLPAYNEINLGRTGSGKTFSALLRAFRETMFGVQTIFIDPQGNGMKVTEAVDGSYNYLKLGPESAINVMDVAQENLMAQVSHVIVMLESILRRELTIEEKNGADRALVDLYSGLDPTREFHPEEMPLLEDLAHRLNSLAPTLAKDLERFVDGTLRDAFNHHTTINLNLDRRYPIITYDLQDIEGEFRPTFVFALLSAIERVIRKRKHLQLPTNIILDEFGILSEIEAIAKAAGLLAKRVRAWKVGIQTLDQNWDTYRTPAGKKIVENALVKVILRVDDTAAPEICSALNLTEHHRDIMLSAGLGEGILIAENKAYHVYFQASRAELEMLTPHTRKKRSHVLDLPAARPAVAA